MQYNFLLIAFIDNFAMVKLRTAVIWFYFDFDSLLSFTFHGEMCDDHSEQF